MMPPIDPAEQARADSIRVLDVLATAATPIPARTAVQRTALSTERTEAALAHLAEHGQASVTGDLWTAL